MFKIYPFMQNYHEFIRCNGEKIAPVTISSVAKRFQVAPEIDTALVINLK